MSELWDEGAYIGNVVGGTAGEAKTGSDQVVLDVDIQGTVKRVFLSLTEKAEPYTLDKLRRLGWNGDFDNMQFSTGADARFICRHDEYQGVTRERWDLAPSGKPMSDDRKRLLSARFRAQGGAKAPSSPAPAARPAPTTTPVRAAPTARPAAPAKTFKDADQVWEHLVSLNPKIKDEEFMTHIEWMENETGKGRNEFGPDEWTKFASTFPPF